MQSERANHREGHESSDLQAGEGRPDLCLFTHAAVCFSVAAQKQHRRKSQLHMNILDKNLQHGGEIW